MGCDKPGHRHNWPSSGTLVIQRCETHCNFCEGEDAKKTWKYAWFLRRHVRSVHIKGGKGNYPNLIIPQDWDEQKLRGSAKLRAADLKIERENEDHTFFVKQPVYETQLENEQMFGLAPPNALPSDLSVEGRIFDPSQYGEGAIKYEDNPDGFFPAFANIGPSAFADYWSAENIDDYLLLNTASDLEKAQAAAQNQDAIEQAALYGNENVTPDYIKQESVDESSDPAMTDYPELPNGVYHEPETPVQIAKVDNDPENDIPFDPVYQRGQRFFFDDYPEALDVSNDYSAVSADDDSDDEFEELPLGEIFDHYRAKPSFDEHARMFEMLVGVTEYLADGGMELGTMMPCVEAFARNLASKIAKQQQRTEGEAVQGWL